MKKLLIALALIVTLTGCNKSLSPQEQLANDTANSTSETMRSASLMGSPFWDRLDTVDSATDLDVELFLLGMVPEICKYVQSDGTVSDLVANIALEVVQDSGYYDSVFLQSERLFANYLGLALAIQCPTGI